MAIDGISTAKPKRPAAREYPQDAMSGAAKVGKPKAKRKSR
jgi:hypothetical protein